MEDGALSLDGEPGELPEHGTCYATGAALQKLRQVGTELVAAHRNGAILGGKIGKCQVYGPGAWAADPGADAAQLRSHLETMRALCEEAGIRLASTAAATAAAAWMKAIPEDERGQTPPRWRQLSHAAIHPGPQVHLRGGAATCYAYDRIGAYLTGMRKPLPIRGTLRSAYGLPWRVVARLPWGVVRAIVRVGDTGAALPPLPVRIKVPVSRHSTRDGVAYPVGTIDGCWTIGLLRAAVEVGAVEVVKVLDGFAARAEPWGTPIADLWSTYPKPLRKLLYTRLWGKVASDRIWIGRRTEPGADTWAWKLRATDLLGRAFPPSYRPEVGAAICGYNAETMLRTISRVGRGGLVAAHVDCIWTDYQLPDLLSEGWALKDEGPIRFYAVGTYAHGHTWGAMGFPGATDPADLARRADRIDLPAGPWLSWHGDPRTDPASWAEPAAQADYREPAPRFAPGGGWLHTRNGPIRWTKAGWQVIVDPEVPDADSETGRMAGGKVDTACEAACDLPA